MRIYEIEDWDKGVKIRNTSSNIKYIYFDVNNYCLRYPDGSLYEFTCKCFLSEDWELYEEPEELIEKKFYRIFNKQEGCYLETLCITKDYKFINNWSLTQESFSRDCIMTNDLAYTAYFKKEGDKLKVVKYVLASGEVIEV